MGDGRAAVAHLEGGGEADDRRTRTQPVYTAVVEESLILNGNEGVDDVLGDYERFVTAFGGIDGRPGPVYPALYLTELLFHTDRSVEVLVVRVVDGARLIERGYVVA